MSQQDTTGYLQVLSPIIHLPQSGLLALYRRLLELNLQLTNAALGIYLDVVYVFSERSLEGLMEKSVVAAMTHHEIARTEVWLIEKRELSAF